jgi:hypothetical protein
VIEVAVSFRAGFRAIRIATSLFALLVIGLAGVPLAAQSTSSAPSNPNKPDVSRDEAVRGKKLFLKDGTYQLVSKYQVIGDRVRYYSVERSDWEEIPASLVDWPATKKANAQPSEAAKQAIAIAHNLDLEKNPGRLDVGEGLGLPAGVLLPPGNGFFAFDGHKILPIKTDLAKSSLDKGRFLASVLIPVPVIAKRYTISLKGKHAAARIANSEPVFFYRSSNGIPPRIRLVHAKVKGKEREIAFLSNYFGQKTTQANEIPLDIQQVDNDTYRLMATQDLSPGEYVFAQADRHGEINLYVWDFGIVRSKAKHPAKK